MRPTNPLWYLAAFLLALGSAMVATVIAAGAWDPVREATVSPTTARADAAGKSLAVFTDIVQTDREVRCRVTDRAKKTTEVPPAALDIVVDNEGNQWHLLGLLPKGADGLKVRCTPRDKRVDNAAYGYATVVGYEETRTRGKGIAILGATFGAGFAAYVFHCRRQRRKETAHGAA